jgi:hypothetical protein
LRVGVGGGAEPPGQALWEARKRRGAEGWASFLAWKLERIVGRLFKLLRSLKRAGQ